MKVFYSKEALITWVILIEKDNDFVVMIKTSESGVGRKARLRLACERSGTYRQPKNRPNRQEFSHKGIETKKFGYLFELHVVKLETDD